MSIFVRSSAFKSGVCNESMKQERGVSPVRPKLSRRDQGEAVWRTSRSTLEDAIDENDVTNQCSAQTIASFFQKLVSAGDSLTIFLSQQARDLLLSIFFDSPDRVLLQSSVFQRDVCKDRI